MESILADGGHDDSHPDHEPAAPDDSHLPTHDHDCACPSLEPVTAASPVNVTTLIDLNAIATFLPTTVNTTTDSHGNRFSRFDQPVESARASIQVVQCSYQF
jgi:hypothetical protein